MDDEDGGIAMDAELPLAGLARSLRMAEAELYRLFLDLMGRIRDEDEAPSPSLISNDG